MNPDRSLRRIALAAATTILAACGAGGGVDLIAGGGTSGTGAPITASGVMRLGSVVLNGVRYDDGAATIVDDRGRGATQLADGMVVALRGRIQSDGLNGDAERVEVRNEVRARIQSISATASPQSFVAGGLTVLVDSQTAYSNVSGFGGLAIGARIEVHGLRDAQGRLRASRVEVVAATGSVDELRGRVSNADPASDRFTLNANVTVQYAGAVFAPAGATEAGLTSGALVEVHGAFDASGTVFTATRVEIEDLSDNGIGGREGEKREVEGFVSAYSGHPGTFLVDGNSVRTTSATVFVGGSAQDFANDVKVEAEGTLSGGVLVASKIEFRHARVILHGLATAVNTVARTVTVLGQTVETSDLTEIDTRVSGGGNSTSLGAITPNADCVEVRGRQEGTRIVAEEIKEPSGCSRDLVQARVTAKNDATRVLTFFGSLNAALGGTGVEFRGLDDQPIAAATFFGAVTPAGTNQAGTLVKVRGFVTSGTLFAEEAELQD